MRYIIGCCDPSANIDKKHGMFGQRTGEPRATRPLYDEWHGKAAARLEQVVGGDGTAIEKGFGQPAKEVKMALEDAYAVKA